MKQLSNDDRPRFWWFPFDFRDVIIGLGVLFICGCFLLNTYVRWTKNGPDIVVYLDKDAKQPAVLPVPESTVVTGDRAALWWTVFNKAIEKGSTNYDARFIANDAVDSVYGKAK
jgi:hypothetical protein